MPLTIQLGEVADRLRRFLDVRGRMPTVLDETIVPVVNLTDLSGAPYRKNPRSFKGWTVNDGAPAGQVNWVVWQHQLGHPGASLITRLRGIVREAPSASGCVVWMFVGHSEVAAGSAVVESVALTEPLGFTSLVDFLPLEARLADETYAAMGARGSKQVDEAHFSQAQCPANHEFAFEPILLRAGGFVALGCQDISGAAVAPDFGCSVSGTFFDRYPR